MEADEFWVLPEWVSTVDLGRLLRWRRCYRCQAEPRQRGSRYCPKCARFVRVMVLVHDSRRAKRFFRGVI